MANDEKYISPSGLLFVWDKNKRAENFKKHKVDFEVAAKIFDEGNLKFSEPYYRGDEERINVSGYLPKMGRVLFVVVTDRTIDGRYATRIISARMAISDEEGDYYDERIHKNEQRRERKGRGYHDSR